MRCLRCGYCCKYYFVSIVKDPDLGIVDDNIIMHNGGGVPCPHLRGNKPGEYSCSIHGKKWYKKTPCFDHTQLESSNSNCRVGEYWMKKFNSDLVNPTEEVRP